jgi:hypothetical protein
MSKSRLIATATSSAIGGGSIILFLAHPVGSAVAGGVLVGLGSYYMMKKMFFRKPEQQAR